MKLSIHKRCSCFTPLFFLLESQVGYHTTERNRVSNWCQRKHGNAYFVDELNHLLVCSAGASPRDESSLHIIGLNHPLSMGAGVVKNKIWYWATRKRSSRNWRGCNRRIRCDEERRKHPCGWNQIMNKTIFILKLIQFVYMIHSQTKHHSIITTTTALY